MVYGILHKMRKHSLTEVQTRVAESQVGKVIPYLYERLAEG